ncbi:uncharacterized protein MELLADRAFT_107853 [Melampsora larici-populina 98AG31]|uniref:Uncharacterized protein n=1 Tax=Melampsora larici-populina (strain 98AG31 / pathotype 3-4-7) TaxID=747676 RepID=F4RR51_MELLP|nr:uncharacterized protein MELLADRAFT_107853 [Melampsora larici-populina 98AG31]EGG05211.1 hypothetical protein MELLADRAFT_107853 [Melampsora larici-populina 98AG31]
MSQPKPRKHSMMVFSTFDVFEAFDSVFVDGKSYGLQYAKASIVCFGLDNAPLIEYPVDLATHTGTTNPAKTDGVYAIRARMVASNSDARPKLYYEADHLNQVNVSNSFPGTFTNNTVVTALGIVKEKKNMREAGYDKDTVVVLMEHSDYDPASGKNQMWITEYRIRPLIYLGNIQALFTAGKEIMVSGHILGFNHDELRFVCNVNSINVTSGHSGVGVGPSASVTNVEGDTVKTPSGRARGKFYSPKSPTKVSKPVDSKNDNTSVVEDNANSEASTSAAKMPVKRPKRAAE